MWILNLFKNKRWLFVTGLLGIILAVSMTSVMAQQRPPTLVVLTANWCGTCREVLPIVQRVAPSGGANVVILDVDSDTTAKEAAQYGISVEGSDVPQVYLSNKGKTTMLFNGKNYKFGQTAQVESKLRQGLQAL